MAVLDVSQVAAAESFKGLELELRRYPGVRVLRVIHPGRQDIQPHTHDRAYIGIYTIGHYRESYDGGEAEMTGPSAVLHPSGRPHADAIADDGLETLTVEFDPAWLKAFGAPLRFDRSRLWAGGPAALASRRLARAVADPHATEAEIGTATAAFLHQAMTDEGVAKPRWLPDVQAELAQSRPQSTAMIAHRLDLNAAWLASAYRYAVGEGMHETVRRSRVGEAATLLRRSDRSLADVAVASGFCDQAHMNRCFRQVLGRTPLAVRSERSISSAGSEPQG